MKINLIVLKSLQPDNLALFYGLLGVKFENHRHGTGPLHYAAEIDNVVFEIYPLPKGKEKADDTLRLGFTVDNLDEVIEKLKSSGVKIVKRTKHDGMGICFNHRGHGRKKSRIEGNY